MGWMMHLLDRMVLWIMKDDGGVIFGWDIYLWMDMNSWDGWMDFIYLIHI
jgi:hypothetical protein